mmetsp:Transcript_34523/g.41299  ORF Transcript_34523/g.41299 Transcript_34523/m.41299 type:complete len:186 (+) Transcript_34523:87-644(+)
MVRALLTTVAITLLTTGDALQQPQSRRQALSFLGTGIAGIAGIVAAPDTAKAGGVAKTGPSSVFSGDYDDPQHPGCLRQVKVVGAPLRGNGTRSPYPVMEITGYDAKGGGATCTDRPERSDLWKITGEVRGDAEVKLDFSPKGGPADLPGKWDNDGILFPDGNKWMKVPRGTNDRRPKDMSTLKG